MTLQDAIAADRNGELQAAAVGYEEVLADGGASLDVLLNLAVLYWQAADPGMAGVKKLSADFLSTAWRRCPELLTEAQRRFPTSAEPRFWERYIAWADLGEPFSVDECRKLLRDDPETLTPAMYLVMVAEAGTAGMEAEEEARELLRRSQEDGTTRARYVVSVIEAILKQRAWAERARGSD